MKGQKTGGAKVQVSLTLSLEDLVKIQRIVERDKLSLSQVVQKFVSDRLKQEKP